MSYQQDYKFANIAPYGTVAVPPQKQHFEHHDKIYHGRVFTLESFFSPEECQYYIAQAESAGFESLNQEYPEEYRNNQRHRANNFLIFRLLVQNKQLSDKLYARLLDFFPLCKKQFVGVKPFGFDSEGTWIPKRIGNIVRGKNL